METGFSGISTGVGGNKHVEYVYYAFLKPIAALAQPVHRITFIFFSSQEYASSKKGMDFITAL